MFTDQHIIPNTVPRLSRSIPTPLETLDHYLLRAIFPLRNTEHRNTEQSLTDYCNTGTPEHRGSQPQSRTPQHGTQARAWRARNTEATRNTGGADHELVSGDRIAFPHGPIMDRRAAAQRQPINRREDEWVPSCVRLDHRADCPDQQDGTGSLHLSNEAKLFRPHWRLGCEAPS